MDAQNTLKQYQYLVFQLNHEFYGFDVLKAREVLTLVKITPLPSSMDFMSGVINLRGTVIPVLDLRKKFGLPSAEATVETAIIVVELVGDGELLVIGALVDSVKGVMKCEESDLEPTPKFGMQLNTNVVKTIAKKDGAFVMILDADKIFTDNELWLIKEGNDTVAG